MQEPCDSVSLLLHVLASLRCSMPLVCNAAWFDLDFRITARTDNGGIDESIAHLGESFSLSVTGKSSLDRNLCNRCGMLSGGSSS